jgi:hypothetical protein
MLILCVPSLSVVFASSVNHIGWVGLALFVKGQIRMAAVTQGARADGTMIGQGAQCGQMNAITGG